MPKPEDYKGDKWEGRKTGSYKWFEIQDTTNYFEEFEKPKIIFPNICKKPEFTFDQSNLYTNQKCFIISLDDKYLLGILNSTFMMFLFTRRRFPTKAVTANTSSIFAIFEPTTFPMTISEWPFMTE